jgi:hypothetical protein
MKQHLPVLDAKATFVDVGSERMHVSVGGAVPVVFGTVTSQLHALRDWLLAQGVSSVAMEATGVYWLALYGVLEAAACRRRWSAVARRATRQDARPTCRTRSGARRCTCMACCARLRPSADIRRLQDYLRVRADHVTQAASCVQLMQEALDRMNVKLHDAISSLAGASGMAVMRAIVAGERNPAALLALCDIQIRRAKAELVEESLRGTWRVEHIFALEQALQSWDHYQRLIAECDRRIEAALPPYDPSLPPLPKTLKRGGANAPEISKLREILVQMCDGRDLTQLPAHTQYGVLQIIGETGTDLTKWATEKHFTSWTGLAPGSHDSGKRKRHVKRTRNRAGQLFCMMAASLARSKNIALGAFYRRLATRRGGLVANKALARKLAAWFWRVMVKGDDYVEKGIAHYEEQVRKNKERALRRLAELGQQLAR